MFNITANVIVSAISFIANIPLGYKREETPKFSPQWFFWIHASIPLIIFLRIELGASKLLIPVNIALAICGQVIGARMRRPKMTKDELNHKARIKEVILPVTERYDINDSDVMVACLNMGGPRTQDDVKPFLLNLFSDERILRFPGSPWTQKFFAHMIVLFRLESAKANYRKIGGGSTICKDSMDQVKALQKELQRRGKNIKVTLSFNYTPPFPKDTIRKLNNSKRKYLLPLSLYPQYSESTTASNVHFLKEEMKANAPESVMLQARPYYLSEGYIQAFVDRIKATLNEGESLDDFYLLFSAHGTPLYFLKEGDIYSYQIAQTVGKIVDRLGLKYNWAVSYQSAVGPLLWLKPGTEDMIEALAHKGIKKLIVIPVAFVTDHIETLEEIDQEYREVAKEMGIFDYRMIKAINTHPGFIEALADCVEESLEQYRKKE